MPKNWTREYVDSVLQVAQDVISLNAHVSMPDGDNETEFGELLEDEAPNPEDLALIEGRRDKLLEYMAKYLKPREIEVLQLRYGFTTGTPMTLEEVGSHYGVTRERIRQIEHRALRRLRFKLMSNNITAEDI